MLPFAKPSIDEAELEAVRDVLNSGWLTSGPKAAELESALEGYLGGEVSVRVFNSATSALEAVLLAHDIGPGDEVIVPAMSFVATANVVVRTGARPVFVDVDLRRRNLDAGKVEEALSDKTRAILPVHFAGLALDLDPIYRLAEKHALVVIEDAAQAIGTHYQGRSVGSSGNPVCFSFHPNKNMTTIEGGALACGDSELIKRIERIRFHGIERDAAGEMDVPEWGGKMNLPDVGAALGLVQLQRLEGFNRRRRELAQRYLNTLPEHWALMLPVDEPGHSWHMFCVLLDAARLGKRRSDVVGFFKERGVSLGIHYPAMHLFSLYRRQGWAPGACPNAERIGEQTLTLPLFPDMRDEHVDQVCELFKELLSREAL